MLHNAMQCTGTRRKMVQMPSSFAQIPQSLDILTPDDQNVFRQRDAYVQGCFYTRVLLHRGTFHTGLLLHRRLHIQMRFSRVTLAYKTFINRYFYTEMLRHTKTFIHRHAVTSTHRCLYIAVLLHRNAFTHRCFWTRFLLAFIHRNFCTQILLRIDVV